MTVNLTAQDENILLFGDKKTKKQKTERGPECCVANQAAATSYSSSSG